MASEKTKLVTRVVVSLLSSGSGPLRSLNKKRESNVPAPTDKTIIITLLLFDMLQRKKRMKYPITYLALNCSFFYLFCDLRRNVSCRFSQNYICTFHLNIHLQNQRETKINPNQQVNYILSNRCFRVVQEFQKTDYRISFPNRQLQ